MALFDAEDLAGYCLREATLLYDAIECGVIWAFRQENVSGSPGFKLRRQV